MSSRPPAPQRVAVAGPVGVIDVMVEQPGAPPRGLALIGHPHPLLGGTAEHKVAHTLEGNGLHYVLRNTRLDDFDAEVLEALEQAVYGSHSRAAVEVIWTEVFA
jgi:hypothetical protein